MTHRNLPPSSQGSHEAAAERVFDYGAGIQRYIDGDKNNRLRPDQNNVFQDLRDAFIAEGGALRGYVKYPTGTGKTVIFVKLSEALLEAETEDGQRPKILVVTPTIDLVHQTVGKTVNKGYGEFAPDVSVSAYFTDSSEQDRRSLQASDVVVTTYKSMKLMKQKKVFEERDPEETDAMVEALLSRQVQRDGAGFLPVRGKFSPIAEQLRTAELGLFDSGVRHRPTDKSLFDLFDVYIFDEVHHVMGESSARIVEDIPSNKPVVGFTATPDANQKRKVESHLPTKIHTLALEEAIDMDLLSPLIPLGVKSDVAMIDRDIFDSEGDYLEERISHLASSAVRNTTIVNVAKALADEKIGTIVSCFRGEGALHARLLAQQMRTAGIRAEAVYGEVGSKKRQRIYEQFEAGELDVLTYVEVLGEGWDSDRAKAIINGRPTRSLIIGQQRLGRILRRGDVALSIDIIDKYDQLNPPLFVSDLVDEAEVNKGDVFGQLTPEQQAQKDKLIAQIGNVALLEPVLPADYSNFHAFLSRYAPISSGNLMTSSGKGYSVANSVARGVRGVTDEILDKLWRDSGREPDIMEGVAGYTVRRAYERKVSEKLIKAIPNNDPAKVLKDKDGSWMSSEGLVKLFSKRYPELNQTIMERIVTESKELLEWKPLSYLKSESSRSFAKPFIYKAYKIEEDSVDLLSQQLNDYFEAIKQLRDGR